MTAEVQRYSLEQIEALELAPGAEHERLEGWVPPLASDEDLKNALEKAFDYRGDVTLDLKDGSHVIGFVSNRYPKGSKSNPQPRIELMVEGRDENLEIAYADGGKSCKAA